MPRLVRPRRRAWPGSSMQLEAEAGRLGDAAVEAAAVSATAEAARAEAAARADTLRSAADTAAAKADASAAQFGRLGALLARSSGTDVTVRLLFDDGATDLLTGLSRAAQLADVTAGVAERAKADRADAEALSAQADVAEAERTRLAAEAEAAADAARAAHEAAEARVAEQQATLETLYAQLASLRDRSVEARAAVPHRRAGRTRAGGSRGGGEAAAAAAAAAGGGGGGGAWRRWAPHRPE